MKQFIEHIVIRALIFVLHRLPVSVVNRIGCAIGLMVYHFLPLRRSVAMTNLRSAFPEKSEKDRSRICRNTYRNFGITFLEFLCLSRLSREKIARMVAFDPPDMISAAMAQNKGLLFVTGHFSSFELVGVAVARSGVPLDVVVKPMKNTRVEKIIDELRAGSGLGVIKVGEGISRIEESLESRRAVALVSDQDAGKRGVMVDFFGINSSTPAGPAVLALKSGSPVLVGFGIREGLTRYRLKLFTLPLDDLPEDKGEKIREITQRYTKLLESQVKEHPDQYLWMHKRWKSSGVYSEQSSMPAR